MVQLSDLFLFLYLSVCLYVGMYAQHIHAVLTVTSQGIASPEL